MRYAVALILLLVTGLAFAQVMTPGLGPMVPNTTGPGPSTGNLIPNEGEMTPNPAPVSGTVGCAGTGYNFTLSCNSQYIVVL